MIRMMVFVVSYSNSNLIYRTENYNIQLMVLLMVEEMGWMENAILESLL